MKTKHRRNVGSYGVDENWSVWMFGKNFLDSSVRGKRGDVCQVHTIIFGQLHMKIRLLAKYFRPLFRSFTKNVANWSIPSWKRKGNYRNTSTFWKELVVWKKKHCPTSKENFLKYAGLLGMSGFYSVLLSCAAEISAGWQQWREGIETNCGHQYQLATPITRSSSSNAQHIWDTRGRSHAAYLLNLYESILKKYFFAYCTYCNICQGWQLFLIVV